jgi:RNA polymerase sigma factor (sigma-70 family)
MKEDHVPIGGLVAAAVGGDQGAWNAIVDRYANLVLAVCRQFRLSAADAADVSQTVWLRLVEQLHRLRDPEAVPAWLITTTRNECLRLHRSYARHPVVPLPDYDEPAADDEAIDRELLRAEQDVALREAFAQLPSHCQQLLSTLLEDPAPSYAQVSGRLGMPMGSIGPTRARCLSNLRKCPAFVQFIESWLDGER